MKPINSVSVLLLLCAGVANAGNYVWTEAGEIEGRVVGSVEEFLGMPYAKPPVGELRWHPPVAVEHWDGVLHATAPGNPCPQLPAPGHGGDSSINEDCLYLNIYRPASPADGLLPVLFWILGGSNRYGTGSDYDPSEMVEKTGILVVTI